MRGMSKLKETGFPDKCVRIYAKHEKDKKARRAKALVSKVPEERPTDKDLELVGTVT